VTISLLIDPRDQSVLAFRPDQVPEVWRGADRIDLTGVLPEFELTVEELFSSLRIR
jgi:Uma2 family endonuclease